MVSDVIDELVEVAVSQGCSFPDDFKQKTIESMSASSDKQSIMYQDFLARRPMEVETYLGSPVKLATEAGVRVPRTETLYAMLHHINIVNQSKPPQESQSPMPVQPPPRLSSVPPPRQSMNGNMRGGRPPPGMPPPRRGASSMGGMPGGMPRGPPPNGHPPPPPRQPIPRDPSSFEDHSLDEFSHLVLYDDPADGIPPQNGGYADTPNGGGSSTTDLALKERELMLRQRELQLREQEMGMRRGGPGRRPPMPHQHAFDEEDDEDFHHPLEGRGPPMPPIDPDQVDMMSITSRRNRKAPSAQQIRKNPEMGGNNSRPGSSFSRHFGGRNRTSTRMVQEIPGMHDSLLDNPMMMYSSNRYGNVDRKEMKEESRANSMSSTRMGDFGPNGYPMPPSRRTSHSPGQPFPPGGPGGPPGPGGRGMPRPGPPPDQYNGPPNGMPQGGRPSPPGMRAPVPRYPPGQGNAVAPQQVEQQVGVSNPYPIKKRPSNVASLTGSANISAGSGDSRASAQVDSENSAQSSQSSLGPQQAMAVR